MGAAVSDRPAAQPGEAPRMRWIVGRDLPAVEAIEVEAVGPGAAWAEIDLRRALSSRDVIGLVAESPAGYVAGYVVYRLDEGAIEILRLGVDLHRRRQGVGRAMLDHVRGKLDRLRPVARPRRTRILAAAPDDRLDVHLWLAACGFEAVSISRGADGSRYWFEWPRALDAGFGR